MPSYSFIWNLSHTNICKAPPGFICQFGENKDTNTPMEKNLPPAGSLYQQPHVHPSEYRHGRHGCQQYKVVWGCSFSITRFSGAGGSSLILCHVSTNRPLQDDYGQRFGQYDPTDRAQRSKTHTYMHIQRHDEGFNHARICP